MNQMKNNKKKKTENNFLNATFHSKICFKFLDGGIHRMK